MAETSSGAGSVAGHVGGAALLRVGVRYYAAARSAAGVTEEQLDVPVPVGGCTVGDVLDIATHSHGDRLRSVLARCSFLLDERAVHGRDTPLRDGQVLDVLPPFAGG